MRVNAAVGNDVVKFDDGAVVHESRVNIVPSERALDFVSTGIQWLGLVLQEPDVVLILVWVESDLLLLAPSRVHVAVRVEVSALSVVVTQGDTATKHYIGGNILHALAVESRLELGRHETVAVTRVDKAEEVNGEHANVKSDGDDD